MMIEAEQLWGIQDLEQQEKDGDLVQVCDDCFNDFKDGVDADPDAFIKSNAAKYKRQRLIVAMNRMNRPAPGTNLGRALEILTTP